MTVKTKIAIFITIILWASGFVGIRAGLQGYSPEGLALLRYLIASFCMGIIYFRKPDKKYMSWLDALALMGVGVIGIGVYNITLNYGELSISSGIASFMVSQAPVIAILIAVLFLGEKINYFCILGFIISILGVALISLNEAGGMQWDKSTAYVLLATISAGLYIVLQKPFFKRYHAIEVTTYVIWGATLFLCFYANNLQYDLRHAPINATLVVIYLGVFPAALAYLAWSYVLSQISVTRASSFLYFIPFASTLLGWLWLNEVPMLISFFGGLMTIAGIAMVNYFYKTRPVLTLQTSELKPNQI